MEGVMSRTYRDFAPKAFAENVTFCKLTSSGSSLVWYGEKVTTADRSDEDSQRISIRFRIPLVSLHRTMRSHKPLKIF